MGRGKCAKTKVLFPKKKDEEMWKVKRPEKSRKAAAWILVLMMTGILSGCKKSEETKKKSPKERATTTTESECTDPSDETDVGQGTSTEPDATADQKTVELSPDRIVFTYSRVNYAWTAHNDVLAVMGDGRIYTWSNLPTDWSVKNNLDNDGMILENIEKISKLPAVATMDMDYLQMLYVAASKVDPNATVEKKHMMDDYGQGVLTYWDEEKKPFQVINKGDVDYIIDDPNIATIEELFESFASHIEVKQEWEYFSFYTEKTAPMTTWNCGYVDLPDGEKNYVFPNYETFLKKAEEWHLDVPDLGIGDDQTILNWPVFVKFDLFSTMGHTRDYEAIVREEEKVFLLAADSCSDPDPDQMVGEALDGYVSVALLPMAPGQDLSGFVTEEGTIWKLIPEDPS